MQTRRYSLDGSTYTSGKIIRFDLNEKIIVVANATGNIRDLNCPDDQMKPNQEIIRSRPTAMFAQFLD